MPWLVVEVRDTVNAAGQVVPVPEGDEQPGKADGDEYVVELHGTTGDDFDLPRVLPARGAP